jgi:hypothetical protein
MHSTQAALLQILGVRFFFLYCFFQSLIPLGLGIYFCVCSFTHSPFFPFESSYTYAALFSEAERIKDVPLPDFHRLVNFPDYLVKGKLRFAGGYGNSSSEKKNCVMCGKLCVCSATSLQDVSRNRGGVKHSAKEAAATAIAGTDTTTATTTGRNKFFSKEEQHIIPRQNKGLCTACDVTVWVVVSSGDGLEIKWCKGCKNFKPWVAFGDAKGSATKSKCVRCRDRQRDKYATQREELRARRYIRTSATVDTPSNAPLPLREMSASDQLAAARGLQKLMNSNSAAGG